MVDLRLEDIKAAYEHISGIAYRTPIVRSHELGNLLGCELLLKLENLQLTGSFKIRGAYNKIRLLNRDQAERGVITASAGNHAQGVALAAKLLGVRATVVMPQVASISKVEATKRLGAEVILHGVDYQEAYERSLEIMNERGLEYVHAYDDEAVIAGQGTIGLEIFKDVPDVDVVIVGVGGGGLISGIALALKTLKPTIRVIGVEPAGAPCVRLSLKEGRPTRLRSVETIADGLAANAPSDLTFKLIREYVDDVVVVSDSEIVRSIFFLLDKAKVVAEGAGAASLAALLAGAVNYIEGRKVLCLISGGNIDANLLNRIILEGLVGENRLIRFRISLPDKPGALRSVVEEISETRGNIYQITQIRGVPGLEATKAIVDFEVEVRGKEHAELLFERLRSKGFQPMPLNS